MKVLVLSRNYPNNVQPRLGLWVEGLVRYTRKLCDVRVIAPVPYCPPLPNFLNKYSQYRRVLLHQVLNGVEVWHPRFLIGPGYSLHSFEANTYYWGVRQQVQQLHREFPFELIHAHFIYPDGVVAAWLGQHFQVPVAISEHALWHPWMDNYPRVCRQAVWAASICAAHIVASRSLRSSIGNFIGNSEKFRSIPIGVDVCRFTPLPEEQKPKPNQILYVGQIKFSKGCDRLLRAMPKLIAQRPGVKLILAGGSLWGYQLPEEQQLHRLARELGLKDSVEFVGPKSPSEIATLMRESALLVLPSQRESFGAVLVEALACGTPVVATRCGGPEDIVNDQVGLLVPQGDVDALVQAISHILTHRHNYNSARLRAYAVTNFAWEQVAVQTVNLYQELLDRVASHQVSRSLSIAGGNRSFD